MNPSFWRGDQTPTVAPPTPQPPTPEPEPEEEKPPEYCGPLPEGYTRTGPPGTDSYMRGPSGKLELTPYRDYLYRQGMQTNWGEVGRDLGAVGVGGLGGLAAMRTMAGRGYAPPPQPGQTSPFSRDEIAATAAGSAFATIGAFLQPMGGSKPKVPYCKHSD
jgi:hypothetical protein